MQTPESAISRLIARARPYQVFAALAVLQAAAAAQPASGDAIRQREIRVGIGLGATHPQGKSVLKFGQIIEARSGGRIRVTLHPSGRLGNDVSMIEAMRKGELDMACPDSATLVKYVPPFGLLNFPFMVRDEAEVDLLLEGSFGQKLLAQLPAHNLVGLAFWENGFRHLTNNVRPLRNPTDFQGVRLRTMQSQIFIDVFKHLGAQVTPMPFTEVFSALQSGRVDGQENPLVTIQNERFNEVQKYLTLTRHSYGAFVLLMSKKLWDDLGPQEQEIVKHAAIESRRYELAEIRAAQASALAELRKAGMKIDELSPEQIGRLRLSVRPVIERYQSSIAKEWVQEFYLGLLQHELNRIKAASSVGQR